MKPPLMLVMLLPEPAAVTLKLWVLPAPLKQVVATIEGECAAPVVEVPGLVVEHGAVITTHAGLDRQSSAALDI